jgi:hypothetical protein
MHEAAQKLAISKPEDWYSKTKLQVVEQVPQGSFGNTKYLTVLQ